MEQETGTPTQLIAELATWRQRCAQLESQITLYRQQEETLKLSEARFRDIAVQMSDWIWEVDAQGHYTYSSDKVIELLGYTPEEMLGKTPFDFIAPDEIERIAREFGGIVANKSPITDLENWNLRKDRTRVCLLTSGVPILDAEGNLQGYRGMDKDITDQKKAAALQQQAAQEREQLLAEQADLQQKVIEAQQRMLKELATPIIPILERIIVMPLIGTIDSNRARDLTRTLLRGISEYQARIVILDITGVPEMDNEVAELLSQTIQAARLKGAATIVTGISDAVAETFTDLGIDWTGVETQRNLQSGLTAALNRMGLQLTRIPPNPSIQRNGQSIDFIRTTE